MAGSSTSIEAGKAFVTLFVKDYAFRRRLAEDSALWQEALTGDASAQIDTIDATQDYQQLGAVADESLELIYNDTLLLTEATELLNIALQDVMDTYLGLSEMQGEGVTLNMALGGQGSPEVGMFGSPDIEGGGGVGFGGQGRFYSGETRGFSKDDILPELGEMMEAIPADLGSAIVKGAGYKLGGMLPSRLADRAGGGAGGQAIQAAVVNVKGDVVNVSGTMATGGSGVMGRMPRLRMPRLQMPGAAPPSTTPVMASLASSASGSAGGMSSMAASAAGSASALGIMAAAALVAVPVLAALDDETSGSLSKSGMYPAWLKKIGDGLGQFGPVGPIVGMLVSQLRAAWDVIKLVYKIVKPFVKLGLLPMKMALRTLALPFKALSLAIRSIYLPFILARKAVDGMKAAVFALPMLTIAAAKGLLFLASSAASAVKSLGSAAWKGAVMTLRGVNASIRAVGSTMKITGKGMAILGAGIAAAAAAITVPLTKAAQQFEQQGDKIKKLTQDYKMYGLSAESAATYIHIASQAGGQLGAMGEEGRIRNIMRTIKEGTPEFEKWKEQAIASGAIMGGSAVAAASALGMAYRRLRESLRGLWAQLGQAVAPVIEEMTELMAGAVRGIIAWVQGNRELISTVFKVAGYVGMAGTAIASAGGAIMALGTAISPLTVLLAAVAAAMAVVEYRTGAAKSAWDAYSGSIATLYNTIMTNLRPVIAEVEKVVGGIKNAIKGGDLKLAVSIAWSGAKLAWIEGLLWIAERSNEGFGAILKQLAAGNWKEAADGAMAVVKTAFEDAKSKALDAWIAIQDAADELWTELKIGFNNAMVGVEIGWLGLLDKMKLAASDMLKWLANNLFAPIANAMMNSPIAVLSGAAETAQNSVGALRTAAKDSHGAMRTGQEVEQDTIAIREAAEQKNTNAELERQKRWADRRAFEEDIVETTKKQAENAERSASAEVAKTESQGEVVRLRQQVAAMIAEADEKAKAAAGPDEPVKSGNLSGEITSSAYAFLGMGGGASVADNQLAEAKRANDEAAQRWDEDAERRELEAAWYKKNKVIHVDPVIFAD